MTQKIQDIEDALTDYRRWTRVRDSLARRKPDFALSLDFHAFGAHFGKAEDHLQQRHRTCRAGAKPRQQRTRSTRHRHRRMTQFNKHDDAKPRWSGLVRLPGQNALLRTIARNDHGAAQYGMHNWHNVPSLDRYHDALLRHAFALIRGENNRRSRHTVWADPPRRRCGLERAGTVGTDGATAQWQHVSPITTRSISGSTTWTRPSAATTSTGSTAGIATTTAGIYRDLPPRPIFWDAAETDDTRRRYTWTAAEAIAWLGIDPKALPGYVNGAPDPLPHRKDVLRRSHFDPAEVRAWANRRGIRTRSRNAA